MYVSTVCIKYKKVLVSKISPLLRSFFNRYPNAIPTVEYIKVTGSKLNEVITIVNPSATQQSRSDSLIEYLILKIINGSGMRNAIIIERNGTNLNINSSTE